MSLNNHNFFEQNKNDNFDTHHKFELNKLMSLHNNLRTL